MCGVSSVLFLFSSSIILRVCVVDSRCCRLCLVLLMYLLIMVERFSWYSGRFSLCVSIWVVSVLLVFDGLVSRVCMLVFSCVVKVVGRVV